MKTKLLLLVSILFLALSQGFGQITINVGVPNASEALPTISTTSSFAGTVTAAGAVVNATYWDLQGIGSEWSTPDPTTFIRDGITVTLPAAPDEPAPVDAAVTITGGGTPTSFGVIISVATEDGSGNVLPSTTKEVVLSVRDNISVAFVLDRSGSMNSAPVEGAAATTRWDILETSTNLFLEGLNTYQMAGDQASLTYFASAADNPPAGFGANLTDIGGNVASFTGDLAAQTPGGGTAMGDGLVVGKNKLEAGPATSDKILFLFTDGEQNRGDEVAVGGTQTEGGTPLNNPGNSIRTYIIGTGAAAGLVGPAGLLYDIANNNNGQAFLVSDEGEDAFPANFFTETFISILAGSSPQLVDRHRDVGTVSVNSTSAVNLPKTHQFMVNRGVEKVGFQVVATRGNLNIRVSKDGTDVTKFGSNRRGEGFYYYNMRFPNGRVPGMSPEGIWEVRVSAPQGAPYDISCVVDDHALKYEVKGHDGDLVLGQKMSPTVKLERLDSAITDAKVTVTVLRPGDDVGHLLATLNADIGGNNQADPGSVGYQKYQALIEQNPDFAAAIKQNPNRMTLNHSGNGVYTSNYNDTDVSGVYQLVFIIEGDHPLLGKFKRLALRSVVVLPPPIDISASGAEVKASEKVTNIGFRPAYIHKGQTRYYGPGWGNLFTLDGSGLSLENVTENPDGSYNLSISGDPSTKMTLSLLGREVYKGKVESFATGGGGEEGILDQLKDWWEGLGLPMWLFWVLIIVILIILGLIARKKKS